MKMKYLLLSTAVFAMGAAGVVSASADTTYGDATHATTSGTIAFSKDESPTNPTDPTNPTHPIEPTDPTNPNGAELMISYAKNPKSLKIQ